MLIFEIKKVHNLHRRHILILRGKKKHEMLITSIVIVHYLFVKHMVFNRVPCRGCVI